MYTTSIVKEIRKLDSIKFDDFLDRHNPFKGNKGIFDLRGISLITPAAMVQLAAVCHSLVDQNVTPVLNIDDLNVRSYLLRSGFFRAIENVAVVEPEFPKEDIERFKNLHGSSDALIEVTKITCGEELPEILKKFSDILRRKFKYKKHEAFNITIAVSEICQNTFHHNTSTCGFLSMQVYKRLRGRFLEIGVSDYGEGLAKTLCRNPDNPQTLSDMESIYLATELGVSGINDSTRGTGLYRLLNMVYEHDASVQIRSGDAKVRFRMDKKRMWEIPVPHMPGVHIALSLNKKRKK